jgi:uncharacterized protein (TIGR02118 family)
MVKTITFIKLKPGMSLDQFGQYWRTQHAGIVTKLPGLRRYVQCHTIPSGYRNGEPTYDGVAEVWFDSTGAMRETAKTAQYRAVRADEPNFIDLSKMDFVITEERVLKDGAATASMVHLVEFVRRKPGMDVDAFQSYWSGTHGPLGAKIPMIRRYVQSHVRPAAYGSGRQPCTTAWRRSGSIRQARCANRQRPRSIARCAPTSPTSSTPRSRSRSSSRGIS